MSLLLKDQCVGGGGVLLRIADRCVPPRILFKEETNDNWYILQGPDLEIMRPTSSGKKLKQKKQGWFYSRE